MPSAAREAKPSESDDLRREAGRILKEWRKARGLLQGELAARIAIKDGSFVSQIEAGSRRLPPELFEAYAAALEVAPRDFAMTLMRCYDPPLYEILFPEDPSPEDPSPGKDAAG